MSSDPSTGEVQQDGRNPVVVGLAVFLLVSAAIGVMNTYRHIQAGTLNIETFPIFASGVLISTGILGAGWLLAPWDHAA